MSSSLKNLESRGLIERIQSADNEKHIEIVLLNKADRIIEDGIKAQKEFAKIALDGLTVEAMIWISAIIRIVVCFLPQNNWCTDDGNMKLSILRNAVFAVTGIGVIILYAISGNANGYHMTRMVAAIIISFGCYLPVTLFSKTKPKVGLLMIPKTCAYMWIIAMGLQLLF